MTDMKPGQGGGPITGGAGPEGSTGTAPTLEKCGSSLGTIAVVEPQDLATKVLLQYSQPSPTGLVRLIIQQSNCFMVVERGVAMQNMMQERRLAEGGQLRGGSNMGQGQMVTPDFVLTPDVVFSRKDAGGVGGALGSVGSLFGAGGAVLGAVAGGVKLKQAQTSMLVADTRTGVQVAAASGSAKKADWGVGGLLAGGAGRLREHGRGQGGGGEFPGQLQPGRALGARQSQPTANGLDPQAGSRHSAQGAQRLRQGRDPGAQDLRGQAPRPAR